jgi:hypothetical protein
MNRAELSGRELTQLLAQAERLLDAGAIQNTEKDELVARVAAQVSDRVRSSQARVEERLRQERLRCVDDAGEQRGACGAARVTAPEGDSVGAGGGGGGGGGGDATAACAQRRTARAVGTWGGAWRPGAAWAAWEHSCFVVAAAATPRLVSVSGLPPAFGTLARRRHALKLSLLAQAPGGGGGSGGGGRGCGSDHSGLPAARASRIGFALASAKERSCAGTAGLAGAVTQQGSSLGTSFDDL